MSTTQPSAPDDQIDEGRRDFIHIMAITTTAAAGIGIAIPVIGQMAPAASVRALATKEVNVSAIEPGQAIRTLWQGKPVFIRRLTEEEAVAESATALGDLKDKDARNENIDGDAIAENRLVQNGYVIVLGVCTHLGCVPLGTAEGENKGEYGGWFCPCHGSHYDALGRIRKGPAPSNLPVPPLEFLSETTVRLG